MAQFPHEALTFDDVTLVTQYADFLPHETELRTRLTRRIELNIPFLSAAMDTVTERRMAIAMAMNGGLGIIHKNLDPEEQARHVRAVKQHLNGLIARPVTFQDDVTLRHIQAERDRRGYTFSGFPILNAAGELVGIVTAADVKFARDLDTPVTQIMTRKVITAPPETTLAEAYDLMIEHRIGKLPLVAAGKLVGLYSFADVQALIRQEHPLYTRDEAYRLRVGAALGPADHARAEALAAAEVDVFVVDTAHGHSAGVLEMVRWLKTHYPERDVIAGNIVTGEAALALEAAGADAVKVGIGPGSICTTRVVAGVGIPQLTAVYHCAAALEDRIPVISDGGIRHSGDVPKALVAGAEAVMMGSILARTEESPGEKIISQGRQYVVYRGMGSLDAMKSRAGSRERYGQPDAAEDDLVPQGIEGLVPYAGTADKVLRQFGGGLRAALGYCGCRTVSDLRARGRLLRITHAGVLEGHAHDVTITKEAPNYRT
ncbi:MAG: IMP dehydrogenase [Candidatus Marinimicrobia bacterium]|nr:IMP dehydrogenase [Candidatus Neomarinimicrobiota bacterium]